MTAVRRFCLSSSLVVLGAFGCDRSQPLEPPAEPLFRTAEPPSSTNAIAVSESRIDISWQDNSTNETGFEVHRSTAGADGAFARLASTATGVTSHSDVGLTPATHYCYKVRAFRTAGRHTSHSQFSPTACATTTPAPPPPSPPSAPFSVRALPLSNTMVGVVWEPSSGNEDGFRVERSTDGGASWTLAGTVEAGFSQGSFGDGERPTEQQVCYRVIAFNAQGDSPPSAAACTAPPAGPTYLTASWGAETIDLAWTDNSAVEDGYVVVITTTCAMLTDYWIDGLPRNSTSYRHYGWQEWWSTAGCNAVGYYVVATRDGGQSDPSNVAAPEP